MKTNFYSGKSTLKWMIRIEKGTFLYQKQKTSDQNTTKLSFSFLSLTSYLKSSFPLLPFIILTSYLKSHHYTLPKFTSKSNH